MKNIAKGFTNLITGSEQEISDLRMEVCTNCHIFHKNFCIKARGGCGCFLPAKTRVREEQCPINKW